MGFLACLRVACRFSTFVDLTWFCCLDDFLFVVCYLVFGCRCVFVFGC